MDLLAAVFLLFYQTAVSKVDDVSPSLPGFTAKYKPKTFGDVLSVLPRHVSVDNLCPPCASSIFTSVLLVLSVPVCLS